MEKSIKPTEIVTFISLYKRVNDWCESVFSDMTVNGIKIKFSHFTIDQKKINVFIKQYYYPFDEMAILSVSIKDIGTEINKVKVEDYKLKLK